VYADLVADVEFDLCQLRLVIEESRSQLESAAFAAPTSFEMGALGAVLQSLYNGIETVLRKLVLRLDGGLPEGDAWHRDLLEQAGTATAVRCPVLSAELRSLLQEYLEFRHFFRRTYSFHYRWERMAHLVTGCEDALAAFDGEVRLFLTSLCGATPPPSTLPRSGSLP